MQLYLFLDGPAAASDKLAHQLKIKARGCGRSFAIAHRLRTHQYTFDRARAQINSPFEWLVTPTKRASIKSPTARSLSTNK
jgi:hypothetical protein